MSLRKIIVVLIFVLPASRAGAMEMSSTTNIADPMSREASGTSWAPDSSPMHMGMSTLGDGMLMWHGAIFPRYTQVHTARDIAAAGDGGEARFDAPSMFMLMFTHGAGDDAQIGLRTMLSADPIFEHGYGYPLLYQSGESYGGQPLHDRQHPHDLISELSATYSRRLGAADSAYLYVGYPGEPALGPPVFMHRVSGMDGPDAPISHHWQDSTHVTFGVVTLGWEHHDFKFEASAFKGREPDENRYDFDAPRLDSWSARLSWNPSRDLALQISHGYLKKPEPAEPELGGRHRTTASAIYNRPLAGDANWATSLVFGRNDDAGETSNAWLLETSLQRRANTVYARAERVQKSGHELVLGPSLDTTLFTVGSYSLGYVRELAQGGGIGLGAGAQITLATNPEELSSIYGGREHLGAQVFLRIRASQRPMEMN